MRRPHFSSCFALAFLLLSLRASAQEPAPEDPDAGDAEGANAVQDPSTPAASESEAAQPAEPPAEPAASAPEPAPPQQQRVLEPPNLSPLELERDALPDPAASVNRLENTAPPPKEKKRWTLPETVFHLHGYMRMRSNYLRNGDLGHSPQYDRLYYDDSQMPGQTRANYDPFPYFTPDDSTASANGTQPVVGGCGSNPSTGDGGCGKHGQVSGDMRMRLKPEIHLSDDVRVKAWIDVMDNVALGTLGYGPYTNASDLNSGNAIKARRMWGEARNRDIGELRFGRMGADWGLGILDNGGDRYGIDSDFSSDVDRLMGMTNLGGFYMMAAWDWAREGRVFGRLYNNSTYLPPDSPSGTAINAARRDDLNAFTGAVAHKLEEDVQQATLARGEFVLNYGLYFVYRRQFLAPNPDATTSSDYSTYSGARYVRLNQKQFTPDLWLQFLWTGLRIELEALYVAGSRGGMCPYIDTSGDQNVQDIRANQEYAGGSGNRSCKFRELGVALESEYRLFDERLGIYLYSGFASGDSQSYGLAQTNDPSYQRTNSANPNDTISTYQFHPDYRIDLILWRTIMQRVAGAYYFKPGIGYDFIRDPYGQQAGARLDMIYSRASNPKQTWGHSGNLGLELDLSLYYRSEDGPDITDGFYGLVQLGVLFPFQGLNFQGSGLPGSKNALILRAVAGIAF